MCVRLNNFYLELGLSKFCSIRGVNLNQKMIYVQPLCNNFISHTHIIFLFSLFLFLSSLLLTNKNREKRNFHCIKWFKYH